MTQDEVEELQEHTVRARGMAIERDARGRIISAYVPHLNPSGVGMQG